MKKIIFLLLFAGCLSAYAQTDSSPVLRTADSVYEESAFLKIDYSFGSNALTNEVFKGYLFNRFITEEMKNTVSKNLTDNNRMGGEYNIVLGCSVHRDTLFGMSNVFYHIGLADIYHVDAGFSEDLFEVYFRGNKNYAAKTADFSDFNFNFLHYQEVKLGLSRNYINDSSVTTVYAGLNLIKGQQFQRIKANRATLYTDVSGEYIDADFNLQLNQSDSAKRDFFAFNGFGLSTDLAYFYKSDKKYFVSLSVKDLGFIQWNDKSSEIKADSTYHFEGIVSNDLFNFNDSVAGGSTDLDSAYLQPFLNNHYYKTYTSVLPATFTATIGKEIKTAGTGTLAVSANINYRINANYIPLTWLKISHASARHTVLSMDLAYGGYSGFSLNLGIEMPLSKGWQFAAGVSQVEEMLKFMDGTGQGFFLYFAKGFGKKIAAKRG